MSLTIYSVHPLAPLQSEAPPVGSSAWWQRPERTVASNDPDTATAQTVAIMCRQIREAAHDSVLIETAMRAADQFGRLAEGSRDRQLATAAWWWSKLFIAFVHHELILQARLGEAGHLQGLISPDSIVRMEKPTGDCAIFTECVCAFLKVYGVGYELVTVAVNPSEPEIFSHVFAYAVMKDGTRIPLDASHGQFAGWIVPGSDVFRTQVWDENGNQVPDRYSRFEGLGAYGFRGFGQVIDPETGLPYDTFPSTPTTPNDTTDTSGTGFDWSKYFANISQQGLNLVGRIVAPTVTVQRGPGGQYLYSAPAGSSPSALVPGPFAGLSSSWLWIGGAAVVVALLVSRK